MDWSVVWKYLTVFAVGGALCVPAQLLIDKTKLTPARILVGYVVTGVILGLWGCISHWRILRERAPTRR